MFKLAKFDELVWFKVWWLDELEFIEFEDDAEVVVVLEVSGSDVFLLDATDECDLTTGLGLGRTECVDGPKASMNKSDSFNSAEKSNEKKSQFILN